MPYFRYRASTPQNTIVKGLVEAVDKTAASEVLAEHSLSLIDLRSSPDWLVKISQQAFFTRIKPRDIVALTRQFAVLISANVPVVETLEILSKQSPAGQFRLAMARIANDVEGGKHLSEALSRYPDIFDRFYVSLVKTGEDVGKLDEVLEYLADQKERDYELRSKVIGMLIYPAFIMVMLVAILFFMMVFVVPNMLTIVTETNVDLPLATKMLIAVSNFFVKAWWIMLILIAGGIIGFISALKTKSGRQAWDAFLLKVPIVKNIVQNIAIVRLATSFSILLRGGVDVVSSLKTVAEVIGNESYKTLLEQAAVAVDDGQPLVQSLQDSPIIPPMVSEMVGVGEQTGRVEKVLHDMASFYEKEVIRSINNLVSLIEPVVIVIMGLGVAVVVAAMILPMYRVVGGL